MPTSIEGETIMRWWMLPGVLVLTISTAALAQQPKAPQLEAEAKLLVTLRDSVQSGIALYNSGKREDCYRIYESAIKTLMPVLDARPEFKTKIVAKYNAAQAIASLDDRAFAHRELIDEVRLELLKDQPKMVKKALWDRLGGEPAVKAVVHEFVGRAASNPKVDFTRGGKYPIDAAGVVKLEQQLVELISAVTGGPLKYTGRDMKSSHKGMKITDAEFDAIAGDLIATLKKFNVPQTEMDELVTIVASTRGDIVEVKNPPAAKKPLWDRLGGEKAVKAVVHAFVGLAAANPKVDFTRGGKYPIDAAGVVKLEQQLVELISAVTGGPLKYTGRDMKSSHKGMKITDAEFDAIAGDLIETLKKFKVPQAEIDELVTIVASTRSDIVEVPANKKD